MLAGMARITISLTVILIETSNNVQYSAAIMVAVLFAKWVADRFNHGLYDIHIHLKHVPLLEPFSDKEMYEIRAKQVMSKRVRVVPEVLTLGQLIETLTNTKHACYPVVTRDDGSNSFVGLLRRDIICAVLSQGGEGLLHEGTEGNPEQVSWDSVQMMFPEYDTIEKATSWATEKHKAMYFNVLPYINTNAFTVRDNTIMRRVYTLFRGMGLRGLPVLESGSNKVIGMITRQNLLGEVIEQALRQTHDQKAPNSLNVQTTEAVPQMGRATKMERDSRNLELEDEPLPTESAVVV